MKTLGDAAREIMNNLAGDTGLSSVEPGMYFEAISAVAGYRASLEGRKVEEARAEELIAQARAEIEKARAMCESPIEKLLVPWLVLQDYGYTEAHSPASVMKDERDRVRVPPPGAVDIWPQLKMGPYRLDFLIRANLRDVDRLVVVECDGRDFHNQYRDEERDRFVRAVGVETLRFTGSEITEYPQRCALKVAHYLVEGRRMGE